MEARLRQGQRVPEDQRRVFTRGKGGNGRTMVQSGVSLQLGGRRRRPVLPRGHQERPGPRSDPAVPWRFTPMTPWTAPWDDARLRKRTHEAELARVDYFAGLDLGQASDFSALVVLE